MSTDESKQIVGMTELMNLRNIMSAWWDFIFFPRFLASSTKFFITSLCLHGCTVTIRQSKITSDITQERMSLFGDGLVLILSYDVLENLFAI